MTPQPCTSLVVIHRLKVRKEIGAFAWHSIDELPADKEEGSQVYVTDSGERHRFFVVWPFVKTLRKWIKKQRQGRGKGPAVVAAPPARCAAMMNKTPTSTAPRHTASGVW